MHLKNKSFLGLDLYKIFISLLSGWLCIYLTRFSITVDTIYNIKIIWSLIFPFIVAVAWDIRYAFITAVFGGTIFIPFLLYPSKGYTNILLSILFLLLFILNGYFVRDKTKNKIFNNIYVVNLFFSLIYFAAVSWFYIEILYYNPPFWTNNTDRFMSPAILRIQSINFIFLVFTLCALSSVALFLNNIRKFYKLKELEYGYLNYRVLAIFLAILSIFILVDALLDSLYFLRRGIHSSLFISNGGGLTKLMLMISATFIICDFTLWMTSQRAATLFDLAKSEEKYRMIFENMIDAYFEINMEGVVLKASPSVLNSFGYTKDYFEGKPFKRFFNDVDKIDTIFNSIRNKNRVTNIEVMGKTSGRRNAYLLISGYMHFDKYLNEKIIIITARNITEYKQEEKISLDLAANLNAVFESNKDLIWTASGTDYRIITFNSSFKRFLKNTYDITIKVGATIENYIPNAMTDDFKIFYHKVLNEGSFVTEYITDFDKRIFEFTFYPIKLNNTKTNISVFARDITVQKLAEAEIIALNEGLEETVNNRTKELTNAYKDLESFSHTVSHEFKTPIREIDTYMAIVEEDSFDELSGQSKKDIKSVRKICSETLEMVQNMMDYSKVGYIVMKKEIVDIKTIVLGCVKDMIISNSDIKIILNVDDMPKIYADKFLINHAIYNIISNSVKFSKDNIPLEISVGFFENEDEVIYSFKDNGVGFDNKYSFKLFTLFNRLHNDDEFEGSGIGLATVKKIIERNCGHVKIEGEKDKGCIVYLFFPKKILV